MGELEGSHRVFVDSSTAPGGANALRYASNIISAHVACPQMGNHFLCYRLMHRRSKKLGHSKEPR